MIFGFHFFLRNNFSRTLKGNQSAQHASKGTMIPSHEMTLLASLLLTPISRHDLFDQCTLISICAQTHLHCPRYPHNLPPTPKKEQSVSLANPASFTRLESFISGQFFNLTKTKGFSKYASDQMCSPRHSG